MIHNSNKSSIENEPKRDALCNSCFAFDKLTFTAAHENHNQSATQEVTQDLINRFAMKLPDTEWRRKWHESYQATENDKIMERHWNEKKANYGSLESGGDRIVDGLPILKAWGMVWRFMDCSSYCFQILRREATFRINGADALESLLEAGYQPVIEPQDFDIVLYGSIEETLEGRHINPEHWGMVKDGKVISKDLMSIHVYRHPVEESAAYSSHVMYFRPPAQDDIRSRPLPEGYNGYHFEDVDGVAMPVKDTSYTGIILGFVGTLLAFTTYYLYSKWTGSKLTSH